MASVWSQYETSVKKGRGGKIEVDILGELYYYCNYQRTFVRMEGIGGYYGQRREE